jgi:hypothetical protein
MSVSQSHIVEQTAGHVAHRLKAQGASAARGRKAFLSNVRWSLAFGFLGALGLAAFYLGIVALAESWAHAWDLFREDALFVVPIVLSFGTQVGLFTHLKRVLRPANGTGATGAVTGTSGGASTLGMLACCAHHLTDVLPLVGLSGAAVFLAQYKVPFMVVGLLSNAIGIGVLAITIRKAKRMISSEGACH